MEKMQMTDNGGELVLSVVGEITMETVPDLRRLADRLLAGHDLREVILDISRVPFIDSTGLSFLLGLNTRIQNDGGSLCIYRPTAKVVKTLRVVGIYSLLTVKEETDDRPLPS